MEIDHGSFYFGVTKKLLDSMDVCACIKQMGSKRMPDRMCRECILTKPCLVHSHTDRMLYRTVVPGFARGLSFEEKNFGFVYPVICFEQWKYRRG